MIRISYALVFKYLSTTYTIYNMFLKSCKLVKNESTAI